MEGLEIVLLLASAASLALSGFIGLRLLWLARKSRGAPELLIGVAFHAQASWAKALICAISGSVAFVAWGLVHSLRSAPPELLWGLVGVFQALVNGTSLFLHVRGIGVLADPLGTSVIAGGALLSAAAMYLTFLPPEVYLRFVRRPAELHAA